MAAADKILLRAELAARLDERRADAKIVFTCGVFDLLHVGHVRYLEFARSLGTLLVVAVNSDASVRQLGKSASRPVIPQAERAEVVAALSSVDYVCIFAERRPDETIRLLRPHIHVKSAQYALSDLPEAAAVQEVGAEIVLAPQVPGHSTTALIKRLRSAPGT